MRPDVNLLNDKDLVYLYALVERRLRYESTRSRRPDVQVASENKIRILSHMLDKIERMRLAR